MRYIILEERNRTLDQKVEDYLDEGWIPVGGLNVTQRMTGSGGGSDIIYSQALIHYGNPVKTRGE